MPNDSFIVGCDECGTGSWAGPLVVVAVRAPKDWSLGGLNDSKKLSAKKREAMSVKLEKLIADGEISWALAERSNTVIDTIGLGVALKSAYVETFQQLYQAETLIIVDGNLKFDGLVPDDYNLTSIVKADTTVPQVMAASILAKVYRDSKMKILHKLHPEYGWDSNVGYGAKAHFNALKQYGYSPLHRMSYKIKGL
jgi:ribonuclease HII